MNANQAATSEKSWSKYQEAIFDFVARGKGNAVVKAVPGSGKSTSIIAAARLVPAGKTAAFVAFNRDIALELGQKLPKNVPAMTLHSFGLRNLKRQRPNVQVDTTGDKAREIANDILNALDKRRPDHIVAVDPLNTYENREAIRKAGSIAKAMLLSAKDEIIETIDDFEIESKSLSVEQLADAALLYLKKSRAKKTAVDFDDMIWIPLIEEMPIQTFDYVFVDETQDMNASQLKLVMLASRGGRAICVGDPRQAIYAFRGADENAMNNIIEAMSATVLPLSVCYRCGTSIVEEARRVEPSIEAAPGKSEGVVRSIDINKILAQVKGGDFIISRTNAPLVKLCFRLLAAGRSAYIQGRDVGGSLKTLIEKSKAKDVVGLLDYVAGWHAREVEKLSRRDRPTDQVDDRRACIEALCENRTTVAEVVASIDAMFSDVKATDRIRLSSTHKAKGLEADRVFMLRDTYHEGKSIEEDNLLYVAITRAKNELVYVTGKDLQ